MTIWTHHSQSPIRSNGTKFNEPAARITFSLLTPPPPRATLFPYTSLFRSLDCRDVARVDLRVTPKGHIYVIEVNQIGRAHVNSSHPSSSYAVFCLKKKSRSTRAS